jgi:hypothetical protein
VELYLEHNPSTDAGARPFLDSPHVRCAVDLYWGTGVSEQLCKALAERGGDSGA